MGPPGEAGDGLVGGGGGELLVEQGFQTVVFVAVRDFDGRGLRHVPCGCVGAVADDREGGDAESGGSHGDQGDAFGFSAGADRTGLDFVDEAPAIEGPFRDEGTAGAEFDGRLGGLERLVILGPGSVDDLKGFCCVFLGQDESVIPG